VSNVLFRAEYNYMLDCIVVCIPATIGHSSFIRLGSGHGVSIFLSQRDHSNK